jgi:hypothetical protein
METKGKVLDNSNLESVEEIEPKVKKKSLIKFIHVFESNVEKIPTIRKSKKKKLKHNLNRNYNRLERNWKVSESFYYLNPSKLSFGLRDL